MNILVVEDDLILQSLLENLFTKQGFNTTLTSNANEAEKIIQLQQFDCIILDIGLPDKDGLKVCEVIRSSGNDTPILILSAYKEVETKVSGLDIGADDYVTKPFDNEELIARINALSRRNSRKLSKDTVLKYEFLTANLIDRTFFVCDNEVKLTNHEFNLMVHFLSNPEKLISKVEILENVFDTHKDHETNFVNVYLSHIRKKISTLTDRKIIKTIKGSGFILDVN